MKTFRKVFCLTIGLIFCCGIFFAGAADAQNYNTQIKKTQKYINTIDAKIKKLSKKLTVSKKKQIAQLKTKRKVAVQQLRALQQKAKDAVAVEELTGYEEPTTEQPVEPVSEQPTQLPTNAVSAPKGIGGTKVLVGFGGGAGMVNLGYTFPIGTRAGIRVEAGYGAGNQYSLMDAGVSAIIPFGAEYVGVRLGAANYSEAVTDIPGISGILAKGTHVGGGIFGGMKIFGVDTEIGYNTDLGLTAGALFKF